MNLQRIFIIYLPTVYILLVCLNQANASRYTQYHFTIPVELRNICPEDYICDDGKPHFVCPSRNFTQCNGFRIIPVVGHLKKSFVMGHNGIRNKVAEDWGIANMNLVHWSTQLETVAASYLKLCELNADHCLRVGHLRINQNYAVRHHLTQRWPGRIIRSWYMEITYRVQSFAMFQTYSKTHNVANFSQMVWPELQFVGCAAASIRNSFYLIVCYYYPSYTIKNITESYKFGKPCTKCMKIRNACSLTFLGLCGIDIKMTDSAPVQFSQIHHIILILCLLIFANTYYFF